jgi:hypothetical protein
MTLISRDGLLKPSKQIGSELVPFEGVTDSV